MASSKSSDTPGLEKKVQHKGKDYKKINLLPGISLNYKAEVKTKNQTAQLCPQIMYVFCTSSTSSISYKRTC